MWKSVAFLSETPVPDWLPFTLTVSELVVWWVFGNYFLDPNTTVPQALLDGVSYDVGKGRSSLS